MLIKSCPACDRLMVMACRDHGPWCPPCNATTRCPRCQHGGAALELVGQFLGVLLAAAGFYVIACGLFTF